MEYTDMVTDQGKFQVALAPSILKPSEDTLVDTELSLVTTNTTSTGQEAGNTGQDIMTFTPSDVISMKTIEQPIQGQVTTEVTGVQLDALSLNTTGVQSTIQVGHNLLLASIAEIKHAFVELNQMNNLEFCMFVIRVVIFLRDVHEPKLQKEMVLQYKLLKSS